MGEKEKSCDTEENRLERVNKYGIGKAWRHLRATGKIYVVVVNFFALFGAAVLGAWVFYELGFTKNSGGVDKNNRYLSDNVQNDYLDVEDTTGSQERILSDYLAIYALRRFYPRNADLIFRAAQNSDRPSAIKEMLYATEMYMNEAPEGDDYRRLLHTLRNELSSSSKNPADVNIIPWMNDSAWVALKGAIVKDSAAIVEAARLTGVEPRMIVACLVGEQVRLFNSKREMFKRYLGPMKVLSVQSKFSLGVNGIKDFTAVQVERNLVDSSSLFYMGKKYEHILDFHSEDRQAERFNRLTSYRNHLYSYIYTGCILHQTMLQWKRSGYDIENRPDILFTLFNLGFAASNPGPDPKCGGSHITVGGQVYTFGVICNDFYFSGELAECFPLKSQRFAE